MIEYAEAGETQRLLTTPLTMPFIAKMSWFVKEIAFTSTFVVGTQYWLLVFDKTVERDALTWFTAITAHGGTFFVIIFLVKHYTNSTNPFVYRYIYKFECLKLTEAYTRQHSMKKVATNKDQNVSLTSSFSSELS